MLPPSDALLRTLAAVPPSSRVLDLGCGTGRHTDALVRLGFDVYACASAPEDVEAARARVRGVLGDESDVRVTAARPAALGYPDDFFDWVIAYGAYDGAGDAAALSEMLAETRRVLQPGGWVWAAVHERAVGAGAAPEALTGLFEAAGFALAEQPQEEAEGGERLLRGIYRKVDETTPL
ncbi:MAG TPA: class I SAM-dependent methyltransferase [Rubricoccaceae bacterium]|nr:class I SAM-dependent methyltransferase [Rubricoccaceae bacterium]